MAGTINSSFSGCVIRWCCFWVIPKITRGFRVLSPFMSVHCHVSCNLHFRRRGSAVFTADVEVDNSQFGNQLQDVVATNMLENLTSALLERGPEIMVIIETEGDGGKIGDPIDYGSVQALGGNYGETLYICPTVTSLRVIGVYRTLM